MKYAVLSDVHGNCPALLKVLEDAKKRNIDHFIIAGDYCLVVPGRTNALKC